HAPVATYYYPNGQPGACGWTINNGDMAVALKAGDYASGAHCGQSITVHYNGHSISVVVADLCPGCQGTHGIDLTQGAMAVLDANYIAHGVDSVTWSF
ncbi:RlpA-like double-psi beta-barrel-protein domain-containing protein-containing protein, partial [Mycena vulgaris]